MPWTDGLLAKLEATALETSAYPAPLQLNQPRNRVSWTCHTLLAVGCCGSAWHRWLLYG